MIFSKNSLSSEKRAAKVYRFFPAEAGRAVNFRKENKTLQKCAGISAIAALPEGVRAEKLYASGKTLFAWCDDKKIYSSEGGAFLALESVFAAAPAFCGAFDGSAAAPLFSDGEKTYVFLSGALYAANVPPFTAACYAYERLWIFGGGKLKFSAPLAYDDFSVRKDGGGEIEAPDGAGGVLALVPFENKIMIFRERERTDIGRARRADGFLPAGRGALFGTYLKRYDRLRRGKRMVLYGRGHVPRQRRKFFAPASARRDFRARDLRRVCRGLLSTVGKIRRGRNVSVAI